MGQVVEEAILDVLRVQGYPLAVREAVEGVFRARDRALAEVEKQKAIADHCTAIARNASRTFAAVAERAETAERELAKARALLEEIVVDRAELWPIYSALRARVEEFLKEKP